MRVAADTIRLPLGSDELREVLEGGRYERDGRAWVARPAGLSADGKALELELLEQGTVARPGLAAWTRATRPLSLTATATPALAVLLYGLVQGWLARPLVAATSLLAVVLLQVAINLFNDVEDHHRLIDLPGTLGGAQVIQSGLLSARAVRRVAWAAFALGLALGLPALWAAPLPLALIGLIAALGTLGYSNRPLGLKYRALGDLAVLALCGPALSLGMAWAAFGRVDLPVVALGVCFGAAAVGLLHCNNWQDATVDRARGAITVAGLLGFRASKVYLLVLYVLAYAGVATAWLYGGLVSWTSTTLLLPLPLVVKLLAAVFAARTPAAPGLERLRDQAAQLHLALGVASCIGLGLALVQR